jgi:hypothetical protein
VFTTHESKEDGESNAISVLHLKECFKEDQPVIKYLSDTLEGLGVNAELQVDVFPRIPVLTQNGPKDFAGSWAVSMAKETNDKKIFTVDMGGGAVYLYDNKGQKYDIFKKNIDGKKESLKPNDIFKNAKFDDKSKLEDQIKVLMTNAISNYLPEIDATLHSIGTVSKLENKPNSDTSLQNQPLQMPIEQPSNKPPSNKPEISVKPNIRSTLNSVKRRQQAAEANHSERQRIARNKPRTMVKGGYKKTKKKNKKTKIKKNKKQKSKTHKRYK